MKHSTLILSLVMVCAGICWAESPPSMEGRGYPGKVVEITDGDTIKVDLDLGFGVSLSRVAIRMIGVFSPERGKPGGAEAAAKLKELCPIGSPVVVRPVMSMAGREQMSFTRYVGRVWRRDMDICEEMTRYLSTP